MQSITDELLKALKNTNDIEEFFKTHENKFLTQEHHKYLNELATLKNLKISTIANNSGAGEYTYKIFSGERKPSRDILIAIALGMGLSLEETQLLLRISKFAVLDSRDKRDSIIIYGLTHSLSVHQTDDMLYNQKMFTLN